MRSGAKASTGTASTTSEDSPTRVIYRRYKDGEIVACLLDVPANVGRVVCYAHLGQHGEGDWLHFLESTKLATPAEYAELHRELTEQVGYKLIVRKRRGRY